MELSSIACFCIFLAFLINLVIKFVLPSSVAERKRLPLPPGSLGWPYIGETFQLYSQNPNVFFASKQKRSLSFSYLSLPEFRPFR
ncbi:hypothetical protein CRG98_022359 [Punica granatum]|uniref:Beta-amyrin 28-monooxygenase-like n=1 Tax=Punica granatum TaxID=22663 RepID=A0A2I0JLU9_PUNGR|nr:hypothetical protein CRG98_022359 [Punica granatum]